MCFVVFYVLWLIGGCDWYWLVFGWGWLFYLVCVNVLVGVCGGVVGDCFGCCGSVCWLVCGCVVVLWWWCCCFCVWYVLVVLG